MGASNISPRCIGYCPCPTHDLTYSFTVSLYHGVFAICVGAPNIIPRCIGSCPNNSDKRVALVSRLVLLEAAVGMTAAADVICVIHRVVILVTIS